MNAEPDKIREEELNRWINDIGYYPLADEFVELVARSPYTNKKIKEWIHSDKEYVRRIGYGLVNYLARRDDALTDAYFEPFIEDIQNSIHKAPNRAREGMNNCIIAIGSRNDSLKEKVLKAANIIG